jgi:hypothetical protein
VSPIVVKTRAFGDVIGVCIVDEVLYLFALLLFILGLVFVIDLGFDIEEGGPPVSPALATMALVCGVSYCRFLHVNGRVTQSFR